MPTSVTRASRSGCATSTSRFSSAQIVLLELVDCGDKVLALTEFIVEGAESRLPLGSELGLVCDVRDGRIASWLGFFNHGEARAAAARLIRPEEALIARERAPINYAPHPQPGGQS